MSRPLKRKLLDARRAAEMRQYRGQLQLLVAARDTLVGRPRRDRPMEDPGPWLRRLAKTPILKLDRRSARAFFGLPVYASDAQVLGAYETAARALVRRVTTCTNDEELATVKRARRRLRSIREIAMA